MLSELHPVIHYKDLETACQQAYLARKTGCTGVFLIHHRGEDYLLDDAVREIRFRFPTLKIGVNRLNTPQVQALQRDLEIKADSTWCDYAGVSSGVDDPMTSSLVPTLIDNPTHKLFAGVAFKYQKPEPQPHKAALFARIAGFIPTTSGDKTGEPPSLEKIVSMTAGLGSREFAIASGISADNVRPFIPYCRYFLVSTSISRSFHEFDEDKLARLAEIIRQG